MREAPDAAEVVVVGGGPVGMGLAIELGQRHIRTIVVERYPTPENMPKGQNLTQRTMEHFHCWGVERAVRAARTIPSEYGIGGVTPHGAPLGESSCDLHRAEVGVPVLFSREGPLPQNSPRT